MPGILDILGALGSNLLGGQQPPPPAQRAPRELPGYGGTGNPLMAGFQNFTQAGSPMGAIGGLITGLTSGQRTDPVGAYQQQANMVYRSLLDQGYPEPQARLMASDPQTMKSMMPTFEQLQPKLVETGTDPWSGQKTYVWQHPNGRITPADLSGAGGGGLPGGGGIPGPGVGAVSNAPLQAAPGSRGPMPLPGGGAGDQGGTGAPPMTPSPTATVTPPRPVPPAAPTPGATAGPGGPAATLAPGTLVPTEMNAFSDAVRRGVQGEDLYNYLPVERRNLIKQMIGGEMPPATLASRGVGAAAQQQLLQIATMIDPNFSPTLWQARSQMVKQLTGTGPSTLGGQIDIGNTAIDHLTRAAKIAESLGNTNFGGPWLSHTINTLRNNLSTDQAAKVAALQDAAQHYGQEITKFYAGGPGGEAERSRFLSALDGAKSGKEIASVIEAEADLMQGRVRQYEDQIRTTLGETGVKKYPVIKPESEGNLRTIANTVAQMRGQAPATPAGTPGAPAAPQTSVPTVAQGAPGTATAGAGAPGQSGTGAPAAPAATTPKVSMRDRYNQLEAEGKNKNQIHMQMFQEGYR
jgi:hypothetical protein